MNMQYTYAIFLFFLLTSVPIVISDIRRFRIPDAIVLPAIAVGTTMSIISGLSWITIIAGIIGTGALLLMIRIMTSGKLGLGDVKYAIFITSCFGLLHTLIALFIASCAGIVSYIYLARSGGTKAYRRPLPFAPYIAAGSIVVFLIRLVFPDTVPSLW